MYAVIWRDAALNELADAFVVADLARRDALEQSVLRLNAQLAADPREVGESRSGKERVAFDKRGGPRTTSTSFFSPSIPPRTPRYFPCC